MKAVLSLSLALLILAAGPVYAEEWGPWDMPQKQIQRPAASNAPLQMAVKLFQKHISPVDGPRCPMYPTCSSYSLQALRKHGPLLGVFQTVDRLYREGDNKHEHEQPIEKWGYIRFNDPLEANDFWLQEPGQ